MGNERMKLTKVSYHVLVYKGFLWLLNSMAIFAMVVDITRIEIQIPNFLIPTISDYHYSHYSYTVIAIYCCILDSLSIWLPECKMALRDRDLENEGILIMFIC